MWGFASFSFFFPWGHAGVMLGGSGIRTRWCIFLLSTSPSSLLLLTNPLGGNLFFSPIFPFFRNSNWQPNILRRTRTCDHCIKMQLHCRLSFPCYGICADRAKLNWNFQAGSTLYYRKSAFFVFMILKLLQSLFSHLLTVVVNPFHLHLNLQKH